MKHPNKSDVVAMVDVGPDNRSVRSTEAEDGRPPAPGVLREEAAAHVAGLQGSGGAALRAARR